MREKILNLIDWNCKVIKYFYKKNQGFARHIPLTLREVFKKFDYIIYLEDDTLPNQDFFYFMKEMLFKYQDDSRILAVNSINFFSNYFHNLKSSFYLSRFFIAWGFGIWRRVWKLYDFNLKDFLQIKKKKEYKYRFLNYKHRFYLESYFKAIYNKKFTTTWDLQLAYLAYKYDKYFITPKNNFCVNLGQNLSGSNPFLWQDYNELEKINKKIIFPKMLKYNKKYDEIYFKKRLRGGWFRLLGIYIYNNFFNDRTRKYLVIFLKIIGKIINFINVRK